MYSLYPEYPDLLNTDEAAAILNCKASTVCRLCRTGELIAIKVGKGWSIPQKCLYDFITKKIDSNKTS